MSSDLSADEDGLVGGFVVRTIIEGLEVLADVSFQRKVWVEKNPTVGSPAEFIVSLEVDGRFKDFLDKVCDDKGNLVPIGNDLLQAMDEFMDIFFEPEELTPEAVLAHPKWKEINRLAELALNTPTILELKRQMIERGDAIV